MRVDRVSRILLRRIVATRKAYAFSSMHAHGTRQNAACEGKTTQQVDPGARKGNAQPAADVVPDERERKGT